jgi:hypothetical protein
MKQDHTTPNNTSAATPFGERGNIFQTVISSQNQFIRQKIRA